MSKSKNSILSVISVYPSDKIDEIKYLTEKSNIKHSTILNATKMQKIVRLRGFQIFLSSTKLVRLSCLGFHYSDKLLESELIETIDRLIKNKK